MGIARLVFAWLMVVSNFGSETLLKVRVTDNFTHVALNGVQLNLRAGEFGPFFPIGSINGGFFSTLLTNRGARFQFELKADGYAPFQSKYFSPTNGLPLFDIALDRLLDFEGVIVAPTGQAAAGALYFLCTDPTEVTFRRDRTFFTRSRAPSEAGPKGHFHLSPELTAHSIVVAHDLGYAQVPLAGWTNWSRVQLRPWGRVSGQMRINGGIAAKERVGLAARGAALGRTKMTLLDFSVVTDDEGRFVFENVPPVEVLLSWRIGRPDGWANSHALPLLADAHQTADIVFELKGRTIVGTLRFVSKPATIVATLSSKPQEVPLELWKAGSGLHSPEFRQSYALTAKPDGTFRGIAIPPGDYILEAQLFDDETTRQSYATARSTISIPSGDGPLDLGEIKLR